MWHNVIHKKYWSVTKEFVLLSLYALGQIHIHIFTQLYEVVWFVQTVWTQFKQATKNIQNTA